MQVSRQYPAAAFDVDERGMILEHSPPPVPRRFIRAVEK
jgi:hypothetical protein